MEKFEARRRMRGQGGFTLIELLVVIAILAVLGGAVVIGIGSLRGNAEESVCKTDKETIETAAEAYKTTAGAYPASVAALEAPAVALVKVKPAPNKASDNFTIDATTGVATRTTTGKYKDVAVAACA